MSASYRSATRRFFGLGMYGAAAALLSVRPPNLWLALLYGLVAFRRGRRLVAYFSTRLRDIYFRSRR